jgi:hypothetical protein
MTSTATPTTVRNADLNEIAQRLTADQARKHDVIAPASAIRAEGRRLVVADAWTELSLDGVTTGDLRLDIGNVMLAHIADRLEIPTRYLRKLHDGEPGDGDQIRLDDLFAWNVNAMLQRHTGSFMVRSFEPAEGGPGFGRALLSDRYRVIDDLDVLSAALDGLRSTGIDAKVVGCDLSENKMRVRVQANEISAYAPTLLAGYRSPFTGAEGSDNPTVFAGFEISNSETGGGSFTIVPRLVVEVCNNGLRMTKDATRKIHLGQKLDEGIVRWSDETQQKSLELVRSETADAVRTFMDVDYITRKIAEIDETAGVEIVKPIDAVEHVAKRLSWSDSEREGIFAHFIRGGQTTAGGVLAAATSYAQTVPDPDRAADIEDRAIDAMTLAAAY